MINAISLNSPLDSVAASTPKAQAPQAPVTSKEDSVHLSPQAAAAAKDADHDGDSK